MKVLVWDGIRWRQLIGAVADPGSSNLPPSAPGTITVTGTTDTTIDLSWGPASDTDGSIAGYRVQANGIPQVDATGPVYTLTGLTGSTTYVIDVRAVDNSGTVGLPVSVTATTQAPYVPTWPDATNTGSSGTLTPVTGSEVTMDGTVIQNREVAGTITVHAANVIIRNCHFTGGGYFGVDAEGATGLLVEDCTFDEAATAAITDNGGGNTYQRLNIAGSPDGVRIGNGATFRNSYIHSLTPYDPASGTHNDGVDFTGGTGITVEHNRIEMGFMSATAISMSSGFTAGGSDCLIVGNHLHGGMYSLDGPGSASTATNIRVTNNTFTRGYDYGPVTNWLDGTGNVWSGNVFTDGNVVHPA